MVLEKINLKTLLMTGLSIALLSRANIALAERQTTRESLDRMEEILKMRVDNGALQPRDVLPAIVVSTEPAFEESKTRFPTSALNSLIGIFGAASLRVCEACMAPQTYSDGKRLQQTMGALALTDIAFLDETSRGSAPPAVSAIWLNETEEGVSMRMVDLRTGRILFAENFDPQLTESTRTSRNMNIARDVLRRNRGESLTHAFLDVGIYPNQHIALDWVEQWGESNTNLTGVSFSFIEPVLGLGAVYNKAYPDLGNALLGGKVMLSFPTAIVRVLSRDSSTKLIDPILTAVGIFRYPIPFMNGNYAINFFVTTNAKVGLGVSSLNTSFLPVLP